MTGSKWTGCLLTLPITSFEIMACGDIFVCCRYKKTSMEYGLSANKDNPEVKVSIDTPNDIIIEQIEALMKATRHISNAKLGINVDWLDFDSKYLIAPSSLNIFSWLHERHRTKM